MQVEIIIAVRVVHKVCIRMLNGHGCTKERERELFSWLASSFTITAQRMQENSLPVVCWVPSTVSMHNA